MKGDAEIYEKMKADSVCLRLPLRAPATPIRALYVPDMYRPGLHGPDL